MTRPTSLLLVSPAFHGYWQSVRGAFENLGYSVTTHLYDDFTTAGARVRNKISYELPDRLRPHMGSRRFAMAATSQAIAAFRASQPDIVVMIKGDAIGQDFWDEVEARRLPRVLWLYDELRRTAYEIEDLRRIGAVASYSHLDVRHLRSSGVDAHHVPLAFDASYTAAPNVRTEIVFIGARYPKREHLLVALDTSGIAVRAYGRDWSHHLFDRVRTWDLRRPSVPSGRDVSRGEAYQLMRGAPAVLNVHGDQDGFTMRTFEASGVGGLQLIDRKDVDEFYDPGSEVAVFNETEELVELAGRSTRDRRWRESLSSAGRSRTMAQHTFEHRAQRLAALWG